MCSLGIMSGVLCENAIWANQKDRISILLVSFWKVPEKPKDIATVAFWNSTLITFHLTRKGACCLPPTQPGASARTVMLHVPACSVLVSTLRWKNKKTCRCFSKSIGRSTPLPVASVITSLDYFYFIRHSLLYLYNTNHSNIHEHFFFVEYV
jgi:hypothetical protein